MPDGHQFKGFPICFGHTDIAQIWAALSNAKAAVPTDLMQTRGQEVRFALRVKVHAFPEDVTATWVMLAVRVLPTA